MNRVFIKEFPSDCLGFVTSATDDLFRDWDKMLLEETSDSPVKIPNIEDDLIGWSVRATLGVLYGSREAIQKLRGDFGATFWIFFMPIFWPFSDAVPIFREFCSVLCANFQSYSNS